jgi:hypothetical protein
MKSSISLAVAVVLAFAGAAAQAETITLRSGQVGGLPGVAGQPDDTVRYLNNNPVATFISPTPFTAADYGGAAAGAPAVVINPHPAWIPGISDPAARWINFQADLVFPPDGTPPFGSGFGVPGSCLYAVPFFVNTPGATGGILNMEFAVDDVGGDQGFGGGNPSFLYINGVATGYAGGSFVAPTFHNQFIPFSQGWNTLYLYQRDVGAAVSGTIFSIVIDVVPAPGAGAALAIGGVMALRRRR